jgi:hypothetical protein
VRGSVFRIRNGRNNASKKKSSGDFALQQEFLKDVITRLESTGNPYAVTGSIASNLWGVPRMTHDLDVLVVVAGSQVAQIIQAFSDRYYISEQAVREAIRDGGMFNVLDQASMYKADCWVSSGDEFNQSVLRRRKRLEIAPGVEAFVSSAEDVLLHKLVWHTITPSDRQLADVAGIAAVQSGKLDLAYLKEWAAKQGTTAFLEAALQGKGLKNT